MDNAQTDFLAIPANVSSSAALVSKLPAIALLLFGLLTLYLVGFSTMSSAHNATHDTRHASGFPCH
jgi:cobalt transporter subunit CbtB